MHTSNSDLLLYYLFWYWFD